MPSGYRLKKRNNQIFKGAEVEELLYAVDEKTIYDVATTSASGLMSASDKTTLNALSDIEALDTLDIITACPFD